MTVPIHDLSEAVSRLADRAGGAACATDFPSRDQLAAAAAEVATRALESPDPPAAVRAGLRALKYPLVARLIERDHALGLAGLEVVTGVLSDLADALVDGALLFARERLTRKHGSPPGEGWADGRGFVVFAMGKHGARELNYSSDIDLVYVVADLRGTTTGEKPLPVQSFADRLGREVKAILEERTPDGFCFRVDLNLRPEGVTGALTTGLGAAEHYFLHYGRTWERAAWLKARPCAGDLQLGEELIERIEPFRFRRLLDFGTLEDIGSMRDRIAAAAGGARDDLKRGPGGIREVEFLAQAGQLVWSGRDRRLRGRRTLEALHLLEERGALPPGASASELEWAYRVLRAVEHRLQWPQEAQTQRLPASSDAAAWDALSRAYAGDGPDSRSRLDADLSRARSIVSSGWEGMFAAEQTSDPDETLTVDGFASPGERRELLARLGFDDVEEAGRRLRRLSAVGGTSRMRPETYRRFERVMPRMLALAARSEDPSAALARLEAFTARVGARGATYTLLHEAPAAAETLVRLFGSSGFLAERFVAHPELLDTLLLRGRGGEVPPRDANALFAVLGAELDARPVADEAITALRTFKIAEVLRIALADLGDGLPGSPGAPPAPNPWLTAVAAACVRGACRIADRAMEPLHGRLRSAGRSAPFAVVGLGSLGSGWMSYGSDLDLVFVYAPGGAEESDGPKPLGHRVWSARWSQRVVTNLTAATREGRCYDVDLRLRPGGKGGPVITTMHAFRRHWTERAEPWERLAVARASVVSASDPEFGARVGAVLERARRLGPEARVELAATAGRMRARQRRELARETEDRWNLKVGRGSITDVEFIAALEQLCDPLQAPDRGPEPTAVLRGGLAGGIEVEPLVEAYGFFRRVEARLRLRGGKSPNGLEWGTESATRLASSLGFKDAPALRRAVSERREHVAETASRLLRGSSSLGAPSDR